jgi:hypothetical protein
VISCIFSALIGMTGNAIGSWLGFIVGNFICPGVGGIAGLLLQGLLGLAFGVTA